MYELVKDDIGKAKNVRFKFSFDVNSSRKSRARNVSKKYMVFFLLEALGGSSEGPLGLSALVTSTDLASGSQAAISIMRSMPVTMPSSALIRHLFAGPTRRTEHLFIL